MRTIIRKSFKSNENLHLQKESEDFLVKIIYSPLNASNEFLYSIIIKNKITNLETKQTIGMFNITKAIFTLGEIIIENNIIKIIPKKRTTSVYNLHEKDVKTYTFSKH